MIGIHCQLVICRGHIRLLKIFFWKFFQLMLLWKNWLKMQISQFFMICGPILKCWKWVGRSKIFSEVNLNMVYGVAIWKQEKIYQGALRSKFDTQFHPCSPLVGDLIKHHLKVKGLAHRFCTYKIFVSTLSINRDINFLIFVIIFWILDNYFKFLVEWLPWVILQNFQHVLLSGYCRILQKMW